MKRPKPDPVREDRIYNEAIVDARPEEQAMSCSSVSVWQTQVSFGMRPSGLE
jgi:hypothetical protein